MISLSTVHLHQTPGLPLVSPGVRSALEDLRDQPVLGAPEFPAALGVPGCLVDLEVPGNGTSLKINTYSLLLLCSQWP
jgi:hypothetical protein